MTTALSLITQALKSVGVLGVGQTALAEDVNDGLTSLKQMLAQWQVRRWLVPSLQDIYALGNNQVSNKIGVGQYYSVPRPDKIQAAYLRLNSTATENNFPDFSADYSDDFSTTGQPSTTTAQTVDYPLQQVFAYEDYSRIALKGMNSFARVFFYDAQYPYGNVFIWPIPSPSYEVHLIIKSDIPDVTNLTSEIILPPEYEEAIWTNLAIRMCTTYQISASKELVALAKVALNTIKNANAQIPSLVMPNGLVTVGSYNIYSDSVY
jgi:hypothetical protein